MRPLAFPPDYEPPLEPDPADIRIRRREQVARMVAISLFTSLALLAAGAAAWVFS